MIPYFSLTSFTLGPFTIYVWGLFVALGFMFGGAMAAWFARRRGASADVVWDLVAWMVAAGMIGGRLGHVLLYDPAYYLAHPIEIFAIWNGGLSVYGGFVLCAVVAIWRLRRQQVDVWRYADILAFGLPFGKWIGRIGCFFIHDHPGTATDFVLGVQYPDGITRHDHGLYLSINAFILAMVMLWLARKERPTGFFLAVFSVWYGVTRFGFDFYRVIDVRYFGLTPGQYFSVALTAFGIATLLWITKRSKTV